MKLKILRVADNPLVAVRAFLEDGTELQNVLRIEQFRHRGTVTLEFGDVEFEFIEEAPDR